MNEVTVSTYFSEQGNARAEVVKGTGSNFIEYYDANGVLFHREEFKEKSLQYVENAAENWALGIKQLNG